MHFVGDVCIEIGCDSDRRVAEPFRYDFEVYARVQHERRMTVPQTVERELDALLLHPICKAA